MDNNGQMPPVQPLAGGQSVPGQTIVSGGASGVTSGVGGVTMQSAPVVSVSKHNTNSLAKTIAIIILSLVALTFIGLFIWVMLEYNSINEDQEMREEAAVLDAVTESKLQMEAEFAEREKDPNRDFAGPVDYGQLSFKYPKTWSVYVAKNAVNGGDYEAYFNPIIVEEVSKDTINALRLTIRDTSFENVAAEYQRIMDKKDSGLSMKMVEVNGITMNRYTGKIPNTDLNGIIVIFKIRDKTAVLQTDAMVFEADFDNLLNTVTFNA